jgi:hypothetical protein
MSGQLADEICPVVYARIRSYPHITFQAAWLPLPLRLHRRAQQRMTEANGTVDPGALGVRPAKVKESGHPSQQLAVDRRTIHVDHAYNATH